jgi:hypothetical protein
VFRGSVGTEPLRHASTTGTRVQYPSASGQGTNLPVPAPVHNEHWSKGIGLTEFVEPQMARRRAATRPNLVSLLLSTSVLRTMPIEPGLWLH